MIYLKILSYLFTMSFILSQDTKYLQGKIIDSKTKDPLIGANVIIKGTAQGSATNVDGDFYISDIVQSMVNLQVSYIGYKTKTISDIDLKDGLTEIIVTTSEPLEKEVEKKLKTKLSDSLKLKIKLTKIIDKEIIGGIKIKIKSIMIDNSIKSKLTEFGI